MEYENIKSYAKRHKDSSVGTTIINYTSNPSNYDKVNATSVSCNYLDVYNMNARNADITNANIIYLMTTDGKITVLSGDELSYKLGKINELSSENITTNKLTVKDTATIENLINTNLQSTNIVTDYLTVNKSAHFFELIIDKIRSVQGTQINTAANCVVDFVQAYNSTGQPVPANANNVAYYRLFWKNVDDDGRAVTNDWLPLDQALCESFNVQTGTSYDTGNKYYWRKVLRTDEGTPKYVNFDTNVVMNTQPSDYEIIFPDGFCFYVVDPSTHDSSVIFEDFNITSQISGEWDGSTNTWTCSTTQFGLQLTYFQQNVDSSADQSYFICTPFKFRTNIYTKLNVGIYYSDGSFDFFKADTYKKNYDITPAEGKMIEAIIIVSAVIDKYEACNWIDLSNSDMDAIVSGKSAIPSKGDNVCQLGYRYTELPNPTQDDINRASAIIIAAYNTPDSSVVPPSYAQYQNITDYNLGSHRKSYFDATGAYVVGNFAVQAAGTTIPLDQYIQSQTTQQEAEIIVRDLNAEISMCVMQVDANNQIHDMNNFPGMTDTFGRRHIYISIYTQQSYSPVAVNCDMFGRTVVLLDIDPNTGNPRLLPTPDSSNGIYVYSVTYGSNVLDVTFDFRGSNQTIDNGSSIEFYGQVTIGGTNYHPSKTIPIACVSTVQGTDAELYKLYKDTELALVKQDKSLDVRLRYGIQHIVGTTGTIIAPTNQTLRIRRYNLAGDILNTTTLVDTDYITTGGKTGQGYWEYTYQLANWYTNQNKPIYFTVELCDPSTNVYDETIVDIILDSNSLFTVEEGLTQSIQANTTAINNEVNARQTQYTSISQTVNNINTTVASHTSSINRIDSSVSEINQTVGGISLSVTDISTNLETLESDIQRTGIDIEQGLITLSADNTIIDGNLNLSGDFESYNPTTQNRTKIKTSQNGSSGLIMSGPDRVDQITGEPDINTQEVDLIKMEFTTTAGARAGSIKIQSANSNNIYNNLWQESIGLSNDDNYISVRPEAITYGLRRNTYDYMKRFNNQSMSATWPAILANIVSARQITSGKWPAASINDCILTIYNGVDSDFGVVLPDPDTCAGKFYLIKNMSNESGVITCNGGNRQLFVERSTTSKSTSVNLSDDIHFVYSDGSYWHVMWG